MGIHLPWLIRQPKVESRVIAASKIHSKIIYNPSARLGFFIHFLTQFLFPFLALCQARVDSRLPLETLPWTFFPLWLSRCAKSRMWASSGGTRGVWRENKKKSWVVLSSENRSSPLSVSRADSYVENARLKMNVGEKYKLNYRTLMNFLPTVLAHTLTLSYNSSSSLWKVSLSASTRSVPVRWWKWSQMNPHNEKYTQIKSLIIRFQSLIC